MSMPRKPVTQACLAALLLALALPALAVGKAEVSYEKPENFADIGWTMRDRQDTMSSLTAWFGKLAERLPDGQTLHVEVTDVDLAGQVLPTSIHNLRVLRGTADWPRIELRYTLQDGDRAVKAGRARLVDLAYLQWRGSAELQRESLPYEKRMLKTWFEQTFPTP
jgi:hypothetical protein